MTEKRIRWDEAYRRVKSLWGLEPDHTLVDYASLIPEGKILDLGIGEGRNSLFLAKAGYKVEGIDISETAVKRCTERAESENLKVSARVGDLRKIDIAEGEYSLIIAAWVLQFMKRKEAEAIVDKIKKSLKKGGLVYAGVFNTDDPGYLSAQKNLEMIEDRTYCSSRGDTCIHYFTKNEFLSMFEGIKLIYLSEGTALDLTHGEPHYHGLLIYMGQKV